MKHLFLFILFLSFNLVLAQQKGLSPSQVNLSSSEGSTYALVVGISDYQDEEIPDLNFAHKDAEAFAAYLSSEAGGLLDENHLKLLINEEATLGEFASGLDWLWEVVKENDKVILYFSGHGDVERKSLTQPGFLLCWDAPAHNYMAGGAFFLPMFQEVISTLSIQNKAKVIVITDACRSGKLSGSNVGGSSLTNANLAKQYSNEIKILSCQPEEYSIEGIQWGDGRGAFSFHLLNGLYGMADVNGDSKITLKEIDRYLEDNVSKEVAPQSQNPFTVGNKVEFLTSANQELLAQIKSNQDKELLAFASTDSKGIEEDILNQLDSNIILKYKAFKKAIATKKFLSPENNCAEYYFSQLITESKLEKIHSTITRNYAAALQDETQQVINKFLKSDLEELTLSKKNKARKYQLYPSYLKRAAELLGEKHYMYKHLIARKLYFEGYLMHIENKNADKNLGTKIISKYKEALKLEPESAYINKEMSQVYFYQMMESDSAEYYAIKASELAPSWLNPYTSLARAYQELTILNDLKKAKYFLELADKIDTTAKHTNYLQISNWCNYYYGLKDYKNAEVEVKKLIAIDSTIVFPHENLANIYTRTFRFSEAESELLKCIELDSIQSEPYISLSNVYLLKKNYILAEKGYKKGYDLNTVSMEAISGLARIYVLTNREKEGEVMFNKMLELDSLSIQAYMTMSSAYMMIGKVDKGKEMINTLLKIDSSNVEGNSFLGQILIFTKEHEKAEFHFQRLLTKAIKNINNGNLDGANLILQNNYLQFLSKNRLDYFGSVAITLLLQNKEDEAYEALEKGLKLGNKYPLPQSINLNENELLQPLRKNKAKWNELKEKYKF